MYQKIVLSPLIFKGIDLLRDKEKYKFLEYFQTERLLCDSHRTLLSEYTNDNIKSEVSNENRVLIDEIIRLITLAGKVDFITEIRSSTRTPSEWNDLVIEKELAKRDKNWKIILKDKIKDRFSLVGEVEITGIENYMKPDFFSKIRAIEKIEKSPGDYFPFRDWVRKYLIDTKKLIIKDGYLASNKFSLADLEHILGSVDKFIPMVFYVLDETLEKSVKYNHTNLSVAKIFPLLIKKYKLKDLKIFSQQKKHLRDRSIQTDRFFISTGHLLGSVNSINNTVVREFTITVNEIS